VIFFGDNTYSLLSSEKIEDYKINYAKYNNKKSKSFKNSVTIANQYLNGEKDIMEKVES
jgi:hypothetical protein